MERSALKVLWAAWLAALTLNASAPRARESWAALALGCCRFSGQPCVDSVTQSQCQGEGGTFFGGLPCNPETGQCGSEVLPTPTPPPVTRLQPQIYTNRGCLEVGQNAVYTVGDPIAVFYRVDGSLNGQPIEQAQVTMFDVLPNGPTGVLVQRTVLPGQLLVFNGTVTLPTGVETVVLVASAPGFVQPVQDQCSFLVVEAPTPCADSVQCEPGVTCHSDARCIGRNVGDACGGGGICFENSCSLVSTGSPVCCGCGPTPSPTPASGCCQSLLPAVSCSVVASESACDGIQVVFLPGKGCNQQTGYCEGFTPAATQTPTLAPSATRTPTSPPTRTATRTPTFTATRTPTRTPTVTPTRTPTGTPTRTPTATTTGTPTQTATTTSSQAPTATRTVAVDLVADAIEVTQAVQDLRNSVRLVANKRTFVRFHVHGSQAGMRTSAILLVNNVTLLPINPGGLITVKTDPDRRQLNDAFLFELPTASVAQGDTTLTAVLNPGQNPGETNTRNNILTVTARFEPVSKPYLVIYEFSYRKGASTYSPAMVHRNLLSSWLTAAYPVSGIDFLMRTADYSDRGLPTCDAVNALLTTQRNTDRTAHVRTPPAGAHYYGLVDDRGYSNGGFMRGCSAGIPGSVASGPAGDPNRVVKFRWDKDPSYADWYGGHEIAHTFGRQHANFCGAEGGVAYPPSGNGAISARKGHATKAPTVVENRDAFFGFDIRFPLIVGGRGTRPEFEPPNWTDLMTYCDYQWVSDFTYHGLLDSLQAGGGGAAETRSTVQTDRLVVTGSIDPTTNGVHLRPLFVVANAEELKERIPGPYAIVLRGTDGAELARYPFTPEEIDEGAGPAAAATGDRSVSILFIDEMVPFVVGTTRVDIEGPSGLLHSITAGAAAPSVTLTSPNGGERLDGATVTVTWTASDLDGDALTFNVLYSRDNGGTWELLAQGITENQVVLDAINIGHAKEGRFRVMVSDGIHTATDDSDAPLTVPNHIPSVHLRKPAPHLTIASGQTLGLEADAYDIDIGSMADDQLQWTSSLDGVLGPGASLAVTAMSAGTHTITFRADDGEGGVATDTVQVNVVDSLVDLLPVPDVLTVLPAQLTLYPAGGQASDVLSITNQNPDNPLEWTAVADLPWIRLSDASGTTPASLTVEADSTLTPGSYQGTVTITSTAGAAMILVESFVGQCPGDCNGDGEVTIDELLTMVNIALADADLSACAAGDVNQDGQITIDEVLFAVNNALNGCGSV